MFLPWPKAKTAGGATKQKGSENGNHHRRAKAKPGTESPHYPLSVVEAGAARQASPLIKSPVTDSQGPHKPGFLGRMA